MPVNTAIRAVVRSPGKAAPLGVLCLRIFGPLINSAVRYRGGGKIQMYVCVWTHACTYQVYVACMRVSDDSVFVRGTRFMSRWFPSATLSDEHGARRKLYAKRSSSRLMDTAQ